MSSSIAQKVRRQSQARTGQRITGYDQFGNPVYEMGPVPTATVNMTSVPVDRFGRPVGGPGCAPQATVLRSHGSACPPPGCTLESAYASRFTDTGCRELTYWIPLLLDGSGENGISNQPATVTMCPTRLVVVEETPLAGSQLDALVFANQNQMIGGPLYLAAFAPDAVQAIPYVMSCIRSGVGISLGITGGTPDTTVWVGFVGPMSG